ncbi:hypothetical protein AMR72_13875 [Flavobacterium psychrophilum]|nr:hypothetical protein AMR72_13875 [Flavobacterium psychrophilum]AOE53515.1 hypothetical protein ALW18_13865 [Flavobacterium psychrophilum]
MKKFLLNSGILALQPFITKIIVYFVLPLYTLCLTPVQFGEVEYLLAIGVFFKTFISMSMTSSFWKYVGDNQRWKEGEVVFSILLISSVLGCVITLLFFLYCCIFQDFKAINVSLIIYFVSEIISLAYMVVNLVIRNNFNVRKFLFITFLYVVTFVLCNYLFVYYLDLGIKGVFYSYLLSASIVLIGAVSILKDHIVIKFDKSLIFDILKYSFPLMLTNLIAIIIMFSDRILIKNLRGSYELGIYSYGFKFGSLIKSVVIDVFFIIWNPIRWKIYRNPNGEKIFAVISKAIFILFPIVGFLTVIVSKFVGELLAVNDDYTTGFKIIPFITFGYIFYGLYYYSSMGLLFKDKTGLIAKIVFSVSCFNVILNFILITGFGYIGAGLCAFVTYIAMFFLGHFYCNKYYNIGPINYSSVLLMIIYLAVTMFISVNILIDIILGLGFIFMLLILNIRNLRYIRSNSSLLVKTLTEAY